LVSMAITAAAAAAAVLGWWRWRFSIDECEDVDEVDETEACDEQ
uniref:Transmembrane protein n=1 Tax=Haemonchus placei TaxID=6290 RepID=A0A0N4X8X8_HAEPC